uniref:Gamma-butyrobetaine hydroxylase-like N-terminal domain-containing protein n=1 Tax=Magnetococcus massalia (strain MO-1) TaxID=451514 RepID=A0A1S7LK95_MAGMO|nr:Conserved protein of unknown function [Candidatus Magnetococcus massalia]
MELQSDSYGSDHLPTEIRQINDEKVVVFTWDNGKQHRLSFEALRVFCPCAECCGHTPDQAKLIDGKLNVKVTSIEGVGHYAVKIGFDDDHDSGIYDWTALYNLGENFDKHWADYEEELQLAGKRRRPSVFAIKAV